MAESKKKEAELHIKPLPSSVAPNIAESSREMHEDLPISMAREKPKTIRSVLL